MNLTKIIQKRQRMLKWFETGQVLVDGRKGMEQLCELLFYSQGSHGELGLTFFPNSILPKRAGQMVRQNKNSDPHQVNPWLF